MEAESVTFRWRGAGTGRQGLYTSSTGGGDKIITVERGGPFERQQMAAVKRAMRLHGPAELNVENERGHRNAGVWSDQPEWYADSEWFFEEVDVWIDEMGYLE